MFWVTIILLAIPTLAIVSVVVTQVDIADWWKNRND